MRIPWRKVVESMERQGLAPQRRPRIAPGRTLGLTGDDLMDAFAKGIVVDGRHPTAVAYELGINPALALWYVRNSAGYEAARARVIARLASTGEDIKKVNEAEAVLMVSEAARDGLLAQARMAAGEEVITPNKLALTKDLMDRAGWRAPAKTVAQHVVALAPETIEALRKREATGTWDALPDPASFEKFAGAFVKPTSLATRRATADDAEFDDKSE